MVAHRQSGEAAGLLEQGDIHVGYRPRADAVTISTLDDIERLYVVLSPTSGDRPCIYRVLTLGRKRPPPGRADAQERYWGLVTRVADTAEKISQELGREEHLTRSGARCTRRAAVRCGEGVYCIAHHVDHTHFAYALDPAPDADPVRRVMSVEPMGVWILCIKNPAHSSARAAGILGAHEARYPLLLQVRFNGRPFISADTTRFLDYEGTQILLVDGHADAVEELGIRVDQGAESRVAAELLARLDPSHREPSRSPLFKARWTPPTPAAPRT